MHIEARLLQEVGKVAQKLHTARSRNDQVVLDVRMYLRDHVQKLLVHLEKLKKVLVALAKDTIDVVMPGYTHLQPAQPVLFAHHIMAYYEMFKRDSERLADGLKRINVMPLGSAALAGTTYPIDRHFTAELLGFPEVSANSMDSVADRDFIIEFLAAAGICMVHFSRLSEELIVWSSPEFGFVEIPDAFATGSSIMPQKKNPDVPELVRGKTGSVFGDLMSMLTLMKSLPMAYNRDMQEDKLPTFRTVDTLSACVAVYTAMLPRLIIKKEVMQAAATRGFLNATDMADYLVVQGMPFRQAHECVGKAVGYALEKGMELHDLSLAELQTFSALIKEDIFDFLSTEKVINRRRSFGGTARENVAAAIELAEENIKKENT
jgi:argininosuccinate lyase